jgi:hypothetical protein
MKITHLFALILPALLVTACIRIDITQTIDKTGSVQVEFLYDLTEFAELESEAGLEEGGGELSIGVYGPVSSSSTSSSADVFDCAAFSARQVDDPTAMPLKNIRCIDKAPNVILVSGTQKLRRSEFIRRKSGKKTVYLYRIHSANKLMQSQQQGIESDPSINADSGELGKELMEAILDGTFTIVMPGKITKSPGGIVVGNRVTFKFTDFPLKRSGFIQSEE